MLAQKHFKGMMIATLLTFVGYLGRPPVAITMFLAVRIICMRQQGNVK